MTNKMTRLKFLELALEGARMRRGTAQNLSETEWRELDYDVHYVKAKLEAEEMRLELKAKKQAIENMDSAQMREALKGAMR